MFSNRVKLPLAASVFILYAFGIRSDRAPMKADFKNSAAYRWLNKKVMDSRLLDGMESLANWQSYTIGADAVVDARTISKTVEVKNVADISLSTEMVHGGSTSLLMNTPTKLDGAGPKNGRGWGRSGLRRKFSGEDWTKSNRLSFWIYPDLPGFYTTALDLRLYNDGEKNFLLYLPRKVKRLLYFVIMNGIMWFGKLETCRAIK